MSKHSSRNKFQSQKINKSIYKKITCNLKKNDDKCSVWAVREDVKK